VPERILTIGHSTHSIEQLLALLAKHRVQTLIDIRRFPSSRKFPHFNQKELSAALKDVGMAYYWFEALGGRRQSTRGSSPNLGLENESFRSYADYMLTDEFHRAVEELRVIGKEKRTAIMCAEAVFWRCHRRLVSDFLIANSVSVEHIMPDGELRPHTLTRGAVVDSGRVTYPGEKTLFDGVAPSRKGAK
jgi:uncharacterized protein (DUF488 family)